MSATVTKLTPSSLAALLSARICHDLISPIGALGTALEVLDDESNTEMHEDAMGLVRLSSKQAGAKLRFLRLAFGSGGSRPGVIAVDELKALIADMYEGGKAAINWGQSVDALEKNTARLLLNLAMLAVQSVPRGGDVTISATDSSGNVTLSLDATGAKSRLDAAIEKALSGKAPEDGFDGRTIQPFYAGMIARELGGSVSASVEGDTVKFSAHIPQNDAT
ncbi:histidine phosphotransferase ChpT [Hellea balneolensis]|uniref:histidine phosphotransferase ChpT n=1 Tax=Hellea balneolensis TaxID=287478 RepID=UPI000405455C|nr:histidine phosphotransferase family protein [Hellea balneolensis]